MAGPGPGSNFLREGRRLRLEAVSSETRSRYSKAFRAYEEMVWSLRVQEPGSTRLGHGHSMPFPEERLLTEFCGFISLSGLAAGTLRAKLDGLRFMVAFKTDRDPFADPGVRLVVANAVKGLERRFAIRPKRARLPITPVLLARMRAVEIVALASEDLRLTFRAVAALALYCGLRLGELLPASVTAWDPARQPVQDDIDFHTERGGRRYLTLRIKQSKTDIFRTGATVTLTDTGGHHSPFEDVHQWWHARRSAPAARSAVPLFLNTAGTALSKPQFIELMQRQLRAAGVDSSSYTGHSLRKGCASTLAHAGFSDTLIQKVGRWKSDCFRRYVDLSVDSIGTMQAALVRSRFTLT